MVTSTKTKNYWGVVVMSYEKELEYLRRGLKNTQNFYDEAKDDERESDAEMWMNRITHLEYQIDVFKSAAKADEYEAKAKAFDNAEEKLHARIDHILMTSHPAQQKPGYVDGLYNALDIINSELKSGEPE